MKNLVLFWSYLERIQKCLAELGSAVFSGGFSNCLALIPLMFSTSYVFKTFFKVTISKKCNTPSSVLLIKTQNFAYNIYQLAKLSKQQFEMDQSVRKQKKNDFLNWIVTWYLFYFYFEL